MKAIKNVTDLDESINARALYDDVRETFVGNLLRVLRVAGGMSAEGDPIKLNKGELAEVSGLSSGTITSLTSREAEDIKLDTLCKIGHALNISPAFLLMTSSDWDVLMQAISTLTMLAHQSDDAERMLDILEDGVKHGKLDEGARAGLTFIEQLRGEDYASVDRARQMRGVLAMAVIALSAFKYEGISPRASALALGATLGDREVVGHKRA